MIGRLKAGPARGLLVVLGGTAGGQLLALLGAPILSRLYPPSVFGPFAVINALVLPIGVIAALRYELAIPLPRGGRTTQRLLHLALALSLATALVGLALVALLHAPLARLLSIPESQSLLLLWVPIIAGLVGAFAVLNQMAIRAKLYGAIARRNLLLNAVTVGVQIAAGLLDFGTAGLALGLAAGQLVSVLSLAWAVRGSLLPLSPRGAMRSVAVKYKSFPLVLAPSGLLNSAGIQAPVVLTAALYGATVSGWLGMTQRVLALPLALIGQAVAQVFLGEFGAARRSGAGDLERMFMRTSRNLFAVGLAGCLVLIAAAPWAFSTFLGAQWHQSGVYAQALAVALMFQMVGNPLSQTIIVMGKNWYQLTWDVIRLVLCAGAIVLAHASGRDATTAIWWFSIASAVAYAGLWFLSRQAVRSVR